MCLLFFCSLVVFGQDVVFVWLFLKNLGDCRCAVLTLVSFRSHRTHRTMVKAVAVLNSSEGVSGTIFFTQEGDGK
jgi:hypothetical protein